MNILLKTTIFTLIFTQSLFGRSEKLLDKLCNDLHNEFKIDFIYKSFPETTWKIQHQVATKNDYKNLYKYLTLFKKEFQKYSSKYIKNTSLKKVVFAKNLKINGQARAAIPDYKKEILILDFSPKSTTYMQHVIHHEFYHMIEEEAFGTSYYKDPKWNEFNIEGFKYGKGGSKARGSDQYSLSHPHKGFINKYSMSGLEEDKAEIYAILYVKEELKILEKLSRKDKILHKKMNYMKEFIKKIESGNYREQTDPRE